MKAWKRSWTAIVWSVMTVLGCASAPVDGGDAMGRVKTDTDQGTFVQWNATTAVTVRHVGAVAQSLAMSDEADVQFFRHPARSRVPVWASPTDNGRVTMTGFVPLTSGPTVRAGQDMGVTASGLNDGPVYRLVKLDSGRLIPGMSGGLVADAQGRAIGINVGNTIVPIRVNGAAPDQYAIYVPYDAIESAWIKASIKP